MNNLTLLTDIKRLIENPSLIKPIYYVGLPCKNSHSVNGKSIRRKSDKVCIICSAKNRKAEIRRKHAKTVEGIKKAKHRKALDVYDEIEQKRLLKDFLI